MRWFGGLFCACALALAAPVHAQTVPAPTPSPSPSPVIELDVTPPPLIPGSSPDTSQTPPPTASPTASVTASGRRSRRRPVPSPSPSPTVARTPTPVQTPTVEPPPLPGVTTLPSLAPTPTPSPMRTLLHAFPLPSRLPGPSSTPGPSQSSTPLPERVLLHALPVGSASPTIAPPARTTPIGHSLQATGADRAYDLVGGKWTCRTLAGTPLSHRFKRAADTQSLVVETAVDLGGRAAHLVESYRYRQSTGRWSVSLADGQFVATAGAWVGKSWTFKGIETEVGHASEATMVYTSSEPDTFIRTFSRIENGAEKVYSGEQCLRVPTN